MVLLGPRIHFYEIDDQSWFPQLLREKVQSCLTIAWTFRMPFLQKTSPAKLVAGTLYDVLADRVTEYTYVDFCAGAGGPTPFIERDLNAKLALSSTSKGGDAELFTTAEGGLRRSPRFPPEQQQQQQQKSAVKFVLTDIHPHIPDWTEASKKSENLSFISESVDAANAPVDLLPNDGKQVFRLFNLAFHHFDDDLARDILKNTLETADGFGIFELQERTISSFITIFAMGILFLGITPFYFWRSPAHLFFTYIVPIVPTVLVFDGLVSSLRTRTASEVQKLMKECGASTDGWTIQSGRGLHTWPTGHMSYVIGIKK